MQAHSNSCQKNPNGFILFFPLLFLIIISAKIGTFWPGLILLFFIIFMGQPQNKGLKNNSHQKPFFTSENDYLMKSESKNQVNFCKNCGSSVEQDAKFCSDCGFNLIY
jgi:hypothetical protein